MVSSKPEQASLSQNGFLVFKKIMYQAVLNLEKLDTLLGNKTSELDVIERFLMLTLMGLLRLAVLFE